MRQKRETPLNPLLVVHSLVYSVSQWYCLRHCEYLHLCDAITTGTVSISVVYPPLWSLHLCGVSTKFLSPSLWRFHHCGVSISVVSPPLWLSPSLWCPHHCDVSISVVSPSLRLSPPLPCLVHFFSAVSEKLELHIHLRWLQISVLLLGPFYNCPHFIISNIYKNTHFIEI